MSDLERTEQAVLQVVRDFGPGPVAPRTVIEKLSGRGVPEGQIRAATRDLIDCNKMRLTSDRKLVAL